MGLPCWHSWSWTRLPVRRHRSHGFDPWVGKIPWRRKWPPIPVFLPGESHGALQATVQRVTRESTKQWQSQNGWLQKLGVPDGSVCRLLEFIPSARSWQKMANVPGDLSGPPSVPSELMSPSLLHLWMQVKIKFTPEHTEHLSLSLWRDRLNIAVFWCNIVFLQEALSLHLKEKCWPRRWKWTDNLVWRGRGGLGREQDSAPG